jgi:hypothetical protein
MLARTSLTRRRLLRVLGGVALAVLIGAPLFLPSHPESQRALVSGWSVRTGPIRERVLPFEMREGLAVFLPFLTVSADDRSVRLDHRGRVVELRLRNVNLDDLGDLPGLERLTALRTLDLSENPLRKGLDLSPFPRLETLQLRHTAIHSVEQLTGLLGLTQLSRLDLSESPLGGAIDLGALARLRLVELSDTRVSSMPGLGSLRHLDYLDLSGTPVEHLDRPAQGTLILLLANRAAVDAALLANLNELRVLVLDGVRDLDLKTVTATLPNLEALSIADARVRDPQPLAYLQRLRVVDARGSGHSAEEIRALVGRPVRVLDGASPGRRTPLQRLIDLSGPRPMPFVQALLAWLVALPTTWLAARVLLDALSRRGWFASGRRAIWIPTVVRAIRIVVWLGPPLALAMLVTSAMAGANGLARYVGMAGAAGVAVLCALVLISLVAPPIAWEMRLRRLRRLRSTPGEPVLLDVPLRANRGDQVGQAAWSSALTWMHRREVGPVADLPPAMLSTYGTAMLDFVAADLVAQPSLGGVLLSVDADAARWLRHGPVGRIERCLLDLYRCTRAPIWVGGDWVDGLAGPSPGTTQWLAGMAPCIAGLVRREKAQHAMALQEFDLPPVIARCLQENLRLDGALAHDPRLLMLQESAFTPVAQLLRGSFAVGDLPDRLDMLTRATEAAVAYLALLLVAEQRAAQGNGDAPARADDPVVAQHLERPTFASWQHLLARLGSGTSGALSHAVHASLDTRCEAAVTDLHAMVEAIAGERAVPRLPRSAAPTIRHAISIIRALRNVTTAHGPLTQATRHDLYVATLATAVELLSALPWDAAELQVRDGDALLGVYRGCLPAVKDTAGGLARASLVAVVASRPGGQVIDVRAFFRPTSARTIAIYGAPGRFVDPVSGAQISQPDPLDG